MSEEKKFTTISIPTPLAEKIKKRIKGTGFTSLSSYVTYVLREVISGVEEESEEAFSKDATFKHTIAKLEHAQSLEPENEKIQKLLAQTRIAAQRFKNGQRESARTKVMEEVDALIVSGEFASAMERVEQAVAELGEFEEAYSARFYLAELLRERNRLTKK